MTQLIDGKKLMEDIRKIDDMRLCFIVEKAIAKQSAPLTREQFLTECEGMDIVKEALNAFRFGKFKVCIFEKKCTLYAMYDDDCESEFDYMILQDDLSYRQALTVIQAHLQAEGGK